MKISSLKERVAHLPQEPGVYFFMDKNGKIIYIGKATNLKSRVQSYFRNVILSEAKNPEILSPRFRLVEAGHYVQDDTKNRPIELMIEKVADIDFQKTDSVLEALILESNLIKKYQPKYNIDLKDDKSFSYFVVTKEKFPKIIILRKTDLDRNVILSKAKNPRNRKNDDIKNGILHYVQDDKKNKFRYQDIVADKIYGPYVSKKSMEIALKIMRKIFPFHSNKQETEKGCLDYQIGLCPGPYAGAISKEDYAKNIRGIRMILEGKKKNLVKRLEIEMRETAKRHEFEKAAELRNKIFALEHIRDIALISKDFDPHSISPLKRGISKEGVRIEAYDISNISGTNAVGSMVVFTNGEPDKSEYRKFKIKTVAGSDDVRMMKEVLLRRFKNNWPMPNLILLDGGQGHLNMGEELLHKKLGLDVAIVAVAKGPTRKKLLVHNSEFIENAEIRNIINDKNLIKQIMDEAHRFAIMFHRKLRRKNALN